MGALFSKLFTSSERYVIAGHNVRVGELQAEGGYSFVYRATDENGGVYALKKIVLTTPEAEHAAHAEIAAFNAFSAPGLLSLIGSTTTETARTPTGGRVRAVLLLTPFYGKSLGAYVVSGATAPREQLWPEQKLLVVFLGICEAIAVLHHAVPPQAHRDIKPDNVLLADGDSPIVIDLGSIGPASVDVSTRALALEVQEEATRYCTAAFRAPELFDVATGAAIDARTDVWSLGATLFCMAFHALAFDGTHTSARAGPRFPREHRFTPAMQELIQFALQQDPAARPNIDQLCEATRRALAYNRDHA
eukprot:c6907_g1_i1.p1 GENE.c6907_g1_i1~~c6907_g1_i1.p1  ORF type:complete len:347 (-),score=53.59 c6907_g1_i1:130-1044(-)